MSRRRRIGVAAVLFLVVWTLTTHGKYSNSGDEPHYLIVSESLLADGDLDLENNYRLGDARVFGPDDLEAGPHARRTRTGALWSVHDIGVSVAILPVAAVARAVAARVPDPLLRRLKQPRDLFAYSLVSLTLILATVWGASLLLAGLERLVPAGRAAAVVLVLCLSPPVLAHAFLVFPETLAFVIVCAVVWLWCLPSDELTPTRVLLMAAAIGGLPWLHRKYAFFVFGLAFVLVLRHRYWLAGRRPAWLAALAGLVVVPQIALHLWTIAAWGTIGGPHMLDSVPFSIGNLETGALGMVFDRERGLVGYAPIYLIAPAAFAVSWRRTRWWMVPAALLFVPMAAYSVWDAGFSPAARFLVPLTPLAAVAAALALDRRLVRYAATALAACQMALLAVVWSRPRLLWPRELGTNDALEQIPVAGPLYARLLPSLHTGDPAASAWLVAGLVVVLTVALARFGAKGGRRQADEAGRESG